MKMKIKRMGLTVVEMLIVLVVMAVLISLLLPAVNKIMDIAKTAKQKAQFTTLEIALESFKNDMGDYPPSDADDEDNTAYNGALKLAEAMAGRDLFGFHPKSRFRDNGQDVSNTLLYQTNPTEAELRQRKKPLIDLGKINAVTLVDLYGSGNTGSLTGDRYVLCDSFKRYYNSIDSKIGMPILYYLARTNKIEHDASDPDNSIYDYRDNQDLIDLGVPWDLTKAHDLETSAPAPQPGADYFYDNAYIRDMKITTQPLPYNKDSFILISAGADGLYGTKDDVFNFEKE